MRDLPYEYLPLALRHGMRFYIEQGIRPGGFLTAVLQGDLFAAAAAADPHHFLALADITMWIARHAPAGSFGTHSRVDIWCGTGGQKGGKVL